MPRIGLLSSEANEAFVVVAKAGSVGFLKQKTSSFTSSPNRSQIVGFFPGQKKTPEEGVLFLPRIGLEPTCLATPEPKSGVSTNFTTWAEMNALV